MREQYSATDRDAQLRAGWAMLLAIGAVIIGVAVAYIPVMVCLVGGE
jgi:hypothetical protein